MGQERNNTGWKDAGFGTGLPKICVPMTSPSRGELEVFARRIRENENADAAEWRADWYGGKTGPGEAAALVKELKKNLGTKPLIFTVRSAAEGGKSEASDTEFLDLAAAAAGAGADLIDCELSRGPAVAKAAAEAAHRSGAGIILSRHYFAETPADDVMESILREMNALGADFAKLAVMPRDFSDVCRLMAVTEKVHRSLPDQHLITMSMGDLGMISRAAGALTGSVLTFGTLGEASAPGQPEAGKLRRAMEALWEAAGKNGG